MEVKVFWKSGALSGSFTETFHGENKEDNYPWEAVEFMYLEGNYSCDCNLAVFAGLKAREEDIDWTSYVESFGHGSHQPFRGTFE